MWVLELVITLGNWAQSSWGPFGELCRMNLRTVPPMNMRLGHPPTDTHLSLTEGCSWRCIFTALMDCAFRVGHFGSLRRGAYSMCKNCPSQLQLKVELVLQCVVWGTNSIQCICAFALKFIISQAATLNIRMYISVI